MAHAIKIDTLAYSKKLRAAGADEKLADAIVEGIVAADTSEIATKSDLAEVKTELQADLNRVEATLKADNNRIETTLKADNNRIETTLKADIAELRSDLVEVKNELKWIKVIGAAIAASTVLPMMTKGAALILELYK